MRRVRYKIINYPNKKVRKKGELVDELTKIARNAFGTQITKEDVRNHIIPVSTMALAKLGKDIIGFATTDFYRVEDYGVIYLVGTCVLREHQRNGVFSQLLDIVLKEETFKHEEAKIFVTRTQNPVLYKSVNKFLDEIYPNNDNTCNKKEYLKLGERFAREILDGKLSDNFVMKGAYGRCMYDEIPRSEDTSVNSLFDKLLDYNDGDAVLIVGKLKRVQSNTLWPVYWG